MRLTTKTDLAARALMAFVGNEGVTQRMAMCLRRCNASVNHRLQEVNAAQALGFGETLRSGCDRSRGCLAFAMKAFYQEMDMLTRDDLARRNGGLGALLAVPDTMRRGCAQVVLV